MVMNKNIYLGLALAVVMDFVATPLSAEVSSAYENPIQADEQIPKFNEYQEPSELQRQQAEHKKANIDKPTTTIKEPLEPSEIQDQQIENNKKKCDKLE